MLIPTRKYSATSSYRYGFNGKENDNDVKGEGDQQDYGMRIYDPRLGRFLSVDPLMKGFPMLTPYQFASNNPIAGTDVDGAEYLSSKKARIKIEQGKVLLEIDNMNNVVKTGLREYFENPNNWSVGEIGADISVGKIDFNEITSSQEAKNQKPEMFNSLDNTIGAPDPSFQPGKIPVANPTAKSTGLPDRRYKNQEVASASATASKGFAIASIIVDGIIIIADWYVNKQVDEDKKLVEEHIKTLQLAIADVNYAIQKGDIPKEYQTGRYLSDIINIVLSGRSLDDNDKNVGAKLQQIGSSIYTNYSLKRKEYTGQFQTLYGPSGQVFGRVPLKNLKYDPEYVKNNPGVNSTSVQTNTGSNTTKKKG